MKMFNYMYENDCDASNIPHNTLEIVESWGGAGYFYSVIDASGIAYRFKQSKDKGVTWNNLIPTTGSIRAIWYDPDNDYIYVLQYTDTTGDTYIRRVNIADEESVSYSNIYAELGSNYVAIDVFMISADVFISYVFKDGTPDYQFYVDNIGNGIHNENMGSATNIEWDTSQMCIIGTNAYFLFRMSNGNVKIWKFDSGAGTFTEMEDCGAGTELPPINQRAITSNGSDLLGFTLGLGTCEVSTIDCSGAFGNLDNQDYIKFYAYRRHGYDYYDSSRMQGYGIWFNVSGGGTPPTGTGVTLIEVDISGAGNDQDISDLIVAAINGTGYFIATNGGGTSTTVTITNYYAGNVTDIADVNSGLSVAVSQQGIDKTYYFYGYNITTDTLTKGGEYNIALMLDRNCNPNGTPECFALEKGFGVTVGVNSLKIYQTLRSYKGRVNWIASLKAMFEKLGYDNAYIVAITDTYLIIDDGTGTKIYLFKYQDVSTYVSRCEITADKEDWWDCKLQHRREFKYNDVWHIIERPKNMTVQVYGTYTAALQIFTDMVVPAFFQGSGGLNDEEAGNYSADPTVLEWIDFATIHDGNVDLVDWLYHRNVIRLQDDADAGEDPTITHNITQATSGTFEFYWGQADVSRGVWFRFKEGTTPIVFLRITMDALDYYDDGNNFVEIQAVADDTFYHIKIYWHLDGADTKFSIWVDEALKVDDVLANNNQISGIDNIKVQCRADSEDYVYIDAPGLVGESDPSGFTYYEHRNLVAYRTDFLIFEGLVQDYDKLRLETVLIESQAREIDSVEPSGDYSGRTDEIIVDINATDNVSYITDGTLSAGHAMGTITFKGNKTYYRVLHNFKDQDKFTFYFSSVGKLYYDDATVGNNVYLRRDATYKDKIRNVIPSHPSKEVNQVTVTGATDPTDGLPYEGTYNDEASQQATGEIIQLLVRDATLNSDALCLDKATNILTRDSANPTVIRFAYYKKELGFMNPGQVFTFKYDTTLVSIAEATYIIDRIVYEAKKGTTFIEASSGLVFQYDPPSETLPEENNQLIEQITYDIATNVPRIKIAVIPPTVNDDLDLGYKAGDLWIDTNTAKAYICISTADGAADWNEI